MKVIDILKKYKIYAILAFLSKIIEAILELQIPIIMADLINNGVNKGDSNYVYTRGLLLFILPLLGYLFALFCQWFASLISQKTGTEIRNKLFEKLNSLDYGQIEKIGSSSFTTRITNDSHNIQDMIAMTLRLLSRTPVLLIGSIVMSFKLSPEMAPIFVISGLVIGSMLAYITINSNHKFKKIQKDMDRLTRIVRENLFGVRDIRAFANQTEEISKFSKRNESLKMDQIDVSRLSAFANPLSLFFVNLSISFILYFSARFVNIGLFQQGQVIALVNYMNTILLALNVMAKLITTFSKGIAGVNRVNDILTMGNTRDKPKLKSHESLDSIKKTRQKNGLKLTFDKVSFAFQRKNVLNDISFEIKPNSFFGIIGGTASGKTTLINLIPRYYDINQGQIKINDIDIKDWNLSELRSHIGLVPQKANLFSGTLRDSLKIANENASDEEIWEALKISESYSFVAKNLRGLDMKVEQGGKNFSGGQRQRLSIARAILRKPELLILDDSMSALDFATEARLRKSLKKIDASLIVVSQRISSLISADQILVLDYSGKVDGLGSHQELMKTSKIYRAIAKSQNVGGKYEE